MTIEELKKENKELKRENKMLKHERIAIEKKISNLQNIIKNNHAEIKLMRKRLGIRTGPYYEDKQ